MHFARVLLPCLIGVIVGTTASAEIYESKDAQGNTVYSDMPSKGAEAVKVPPTNSADPLAETPRPPPSPETPKTTATPRKSTARPTSSTDRDTDDDYLYYGGDNDYDNADDRTRREKRRDEDDIAKPKKDRPAKVEPHRNVSRPAVGGGGRR